MDLLSSATCKSRKSYSALMLPSQRRKTFSSFSSSRLHGKDNIAIKRYVISFWNGIDLRYKLLKHPSVKISIAGIIISRVSDSFRKVISLVKTLAIFRKRSIF